jgi:putative methyltransferase
MTRFANRTRRSASIPRRLVSEGKLHLLPVYALMRTSDLGREGIENSGSFRFADHIYRNAPSGRYGVGQLLDAVLLRMRSARSLRNRFFHARREIVRAAGRVPEGGELRALSVPCGIARDLVEGARAIRARHPHVFARATFQGLDLDAEPLALSRGLAADEERFSFRQGDALDPASYPAPLDVVVSTGLGEFLDDETLVRFYRTVHGALRPGGVFATSATDTDRLSVYLMRELAELEAYYRTSEQATALLARAGFRDIHAVADDVGLQTLLVARRDDSQGGEDR